MAHSNARAPWLQPVQPTLQPVQPSLQPTLQPVQPSLQPVQPTLQVPPGGLQLVGVDGEDLDLVFVDDSVEAAEEAAKLKERELKRKRQSSKDSKT